MNQVDLVCPRCGAMNRPRATVIELHPNKRTAECAVCSYSALATEFLPKEK